MILLRALVGMTIAARFAVSVVGVVASVLWQGGTILASRTQR